MTPPLTPAELPRKALGGAQAMLCGAAVAIGELGGEDGWLEGGGERT